MSAITNGEARVAAIYPIHLLGDPASPPDWLIAVAEDVFAPDLEQILKEFSELASVNFNQSSDRQLAADIALAWVEANRFGYLIQVEVADRHYITETTFQVGWGILRLGWLHLVDIDELADALDGFAEATHAEAKASFLREAAGAIS